MTFALPTATRQLSPPSSGWPQVTTLPSAKIAANAKEVLSILRTSLSKCCTKLLAPPVSSVHSATFQMNSDSTTSDRLHKWFGLTFFLNPDLSMSTLPRWLQTNKKGWKMYTRHEATNTFQACAGVQMPPCDHGAIFQNGSKIETVAFESTHFCQSIANPWAVTTKPRVAPSFDLQQPNRTPGLEMFPECSHWTHTVSDLYILYILVYFQNMRQKNLSLRHGTDPSAKSAANACAVDSICWTGRWQAASSLGFSRMPWMFPPNCGSPQQRAPPLLNLESKVTTIKKGFRLRNQSILKNCQKWIAGPVTTLQMPFALHTSSVAVRLQSVSHHFQLQRREVLPKTSKRAR